MKIICNQGSSSQKKETCYFIVFLWGWLFFIKIQDLILRAAGILRKNQLGLWANAPSVNAWIEYDMRRHFNNPYGKVIKRKVCLTHTSATYRYYRITRRSNTQLFVINLSDQSESHSMSICIKIVTWFKIGKISRAYNLPIFSGKNYQILNYQLPNSN